LLPNWI